MTQKNNNEPQQYANPIQSRAQILQHLKDRNIPASLKELIAELKLETADSQEALRRRTNAMIRDGQLERLTKGRYWPSGDHTLTEGKVLIDRNQMPWVIPKDGGKRIALLKSATRGIFSGQKVIVSVINIPSATKLEGKIVEILEQANLTITGKFIEDFGFNYVVANGQTQGKNILIPLGQENAAVHGQIVVVERLLTDSSWKEPIGKIIEILGDASTAGIELEAAIRTYELPNTWSEQSLIEIKKFTSTVAPQAKKAREDLTTLPLVTIDGDDSKDYDDAVYCTPRADGGWKLYVAIADVSHYVKTNTALDQDAALRGNSVYFPNKVIPMLPEILSNELCSLKPNVLRLCMVCEMLVNNIGVVTRYKFYPACIQSQARLTYNQVAKILEQDVTELKNITSPVKENLFNLHALYEKLKQERQNRGAIDFETIETKIIFGKNNKIKKIIPTERNVAHKIIEECMLAANVATAKFLKKHKVLGIYRIHESPPEEKIQDLRTFLSALGLSLGHKQDPQPMDYSRLLNAIKQRPDANVIQTVLLRSLSQAEYSANNIGHFGLSYEAYTHFTSPIRRYPDLLVHRQIKNILANNLSDPMLNDIQKVTNIADHCSATERKADDAVRDVVRSLKCQYMLQHIGNTFPGVISGVTRFGLFVELKDIYIDGLVHITSLRDDYYFYDQVHHNLIGERTGIVYALGQAVDVIVSQVNTESKRIDLDLVIKHKKSIKLKPLPKSNRKSKIANKPKSKPTYKSKATSQPKAKVKKKSSNK